MTIISFHHAHGMVPNIYSKTFKFRASDELIYIIRSKRNVIFGGEES